MRWLLIAFAGGCWIGCSSPAKVCTISMAGGAPTLQLFHTNAAGDEVNTQSMDEVPMEQPPQGGWVFYVIPHATNMDCQVQLTTSLTDTCSNQVVVFESRPVVLEDDGTGWGVPINTSNDGLVAACPQSAITRNLYDVPYLLDVVAEDKDGHRAEVSVQVVPTCSDPYCRCQCDRTYQLGDTCTSVPDAGVPAACP